MKASKITLDQIIKFNNGITMMGNVGVNLPVGVSYDLAMFKHSTQVYIKAYTEALKEFKGEPADRAAEAEKLMANEYEVTVPALKKKDLEASKTPIPLGVFEFIGEFIG